MRGLTVGAGVWVGQGIAKGGGNWDNCTRKTIKKETKFIGTDLSSFHTFIHLILK